MNKKEILEAITEVRKNSKKRNFKQKFDLIINLKDLDLKKVENQVETYISLHYPNGKPKKIGAFIGPELGSQKDDVDTAIISDDFDKYKDKKVLKKLANSHDYFIAQATLMAKVATTFGAVLGPRGKMPSPKAGCVVPPNANLKQVAEKLHNLIKVSAKIVPIVQVIVGGEDSKDEEIVDNTLTIFNGLIHALPNEKHNIKNVLLKYTMGKPVLIGKQKETKSKKEDPKNHKLKPIKKDTKKPTNVEKDSEEIEKDSKKEETKKDTPKKKETKTDDTKEDVK